MLQAFACQHVMELLQCLYTLQNGILGRHGYMMIGQRLRLARQRAGNGAGNSAQPGFDRFEQKVPRPLALAAAGCVDLFMEHAPMEWTK